MSHNIKTFQNIVTRFAPSPTGSFHVGSARTALFNYLAAKKYGGKMILRIEDTDRERSKGEYEKEIIEGLEWLGIQYEEMYRQSERADIYKKHIERLLKDGAAYESDKEEGKVIRFKNPNKQITFTDLVRGDISFDTTELGDFIIARSETEPLYHLAVVIDDFESGITHVIRGEDHISNTPRQILIQEALQIPRPEYVHIPLVLAADRSKLSKRHGAVPVREYKEEGYLPEALVNFLALLGWSPEGDKEIFTLEELVERFSFDRIHKGGAVFNAVKLLWINRAHLKRLSPEELKEKFIEFSPDVKDLLQYSEERLLRALLILREHLGMFKDFIRAIRKGGEMDYFFNTPSYKVSTLAWKDTQLKEVSKHLRQIVKLLKTSEDNFSEEDVKNTVWSYAEEKGRGAVLWPMRYALSGKNNSPSPFVIAGILGKDETLKRLEVALEKLK